MKRTFKDKANRYKITATAELSWRKGNPKPCFSLTADGKDRGSEFGGCCHDEILKHWPDLQPLVDLHLSDIDGVPLHALENGFYFLAGNLKIDWWNTPVPQNIPHAASHFRITEDEARQLVADYFGDSFSPTAGFLSKGAAAKAQAALAQWVETQKPRWLAEATAAIEQFKLARPSKPE